VYVPSVAGGGGEEEEKKEEKEEKRRRRRGRQGDISATCGVSQPESTTVQGAVRT
jgi:hypothetical protein